MFAIRPRRACVTRDNSRRARFEIGRRECPAGRNVLLQSSAGCDADAVELRGQCDDKTGLLMCLKRFRRYKQGWFGEMTAIFFLEDTTIHVMHKLVVEGGYG